MGDGLIMVETAQRIPTKLQRELILRAPSTIRSNLMRCGVTGQELENSIKGTIDNHREAAKEFGLVQELAQVLEVEGWLY